MLDALFQRRVSGFLVVHSDFVAASLLGHLANFYLFTPLAAQKLRKFSC
jgi:hypothetical protein